MQKTRITLNRPVPLDAILASLRIYAAPISVPTDIHTISTDSRKCREGDLFVSLAGDEKKSRDHISEAKAKGAITAGKGGDIDTEETDHLILELGRCVKATLPHLQKTVAITGSIGKTTTKEFLKTILSAKYTVHATEKNHNNALGMPLTLLTANEATEILVLELGMNHRGEISLLSQYCEPDIGIITNIGSAHIGNLGSREQIAQAKLEILDGMSEKGILLCNADEPLLANTKSRTTFAASTINADYKLLEHPKKQGKLCFYAPDGTHSTLFSPCPPHIYPDLAAACAAAHISGMSTEEIARGAERIHQDQLRFKLTKCGGYTLLDDSYNASYESVCASLSYLRTLEAKRYSAVLGDILELGEHSEKIHRSIGEYAAGVGLDTLFLYGSQAEITAGGAISRGMSENSIFYLPQTDNFDLLAEIIRKELSDGEAILIKGSHACGLHRLAERMKGEGI